MEIALATKDDITDILSISNWAAMNTTANFATEPEPHADWLAAWEKTHVFYPWLVARSPEGATLGFAKASPHRARGAYAWSADVSVYVHPDAHRRGIGRLLYDRLLATMKAQGFVTLLAGITLPNPASVRLHEAVGFVKTGVFPKVGWKNAGWHDVAYFARALDASDAPPRPRKTVDEAWQVIGRGGAGTP